MAISIKILMKAPQVANTVLYINMYTVNQKKRDILFLTNLNQFL